MTTDRDLYAEVTALKALIAAMLAALANRDPDLAREIVAACDAIPRPSPGVTVLDPFQARIAVAVDNLLDDLRDSLAAE